MSDTPFLANLLARPSRLNPAPEPLLRAAVRAATQTAGRAEDSGEDSDRNEDLLRDIAATQRAIPADVAEQLLAALTAEAVFDSVLDNDFFPGIVELRRAMVASMTSGRQYQKLTSFTDPVVLQSAVARLPHLTDTPLAAAMLLRNPAFTAELAATLLTFLADQLRLAACVAPAAGNSADETWPSRMVTNSVSFYLRAHPGAAALVLDTFTSPAVLAVTLPLLAAPTDAQWARLRDVLTYPSPWAVDVPEALQPFAACELAAEIRRHPAAPAPVALHAQEYLDRARAAALMLEEGAPGLPVTGPAVVEFGPALVGMLLDNENAGRLMDGFAIRRLWRLPGERSRVWRCATLEQRRQNLGDVLHSERGFTQLREFAELDPAGVEELILSSTGRRGLTTELTGETANVRYPDKDDRREAVIALIRPQTLRLLPWPTVRALSYCSSPLRAWVGQQLSDALTLPGSDVVLAAMLDTYPGTLADLPAAVAGVLSEPAQQAG